MARTHGEAEDAGEEDEGEEEGKKEVSQVLDRNMQKD